MSYGIEFTAQLPHMNTDNIASNIEITEGVLQMLTQQVIALAADTTAKMYDPETDSYRSRHELIAYKLPELIEDIASCTAKLSLLYAADSASDVVGY